LRDVATQVYGKQSAREAVIAFLGAPVKRLDLAQAQSYATGAAGR
jgi:hypothetical protein